MAMVESALELLQRLCNEAATQSGDDFKQMEKLVAEAIAALPADQKSSFHTGLARFLNMQTALNAHVRGPTDLH